MHGSVIWERCNKEQLVGCLTLLFSKLCEEGEGCITKCITAFFGETVASFRAGFMDENKILLFELEESICQQQEGLKVFLGLREWHDMYLWARWLKGTSSPAAWVFVRGIGKNFFLKIDKNFFLITVLWEIKSFFWRGMRTLEQHETVYCIRLIYPELRARILVSLYF